MNKTNKAGKWKAICTNIFQLTYMVVFVRVRGLSGSSLKATEGIGDIIF